MSILRPPFDHISAIANVGATEDVWNRRDPERDLAAYTEDGFMRREARINDVIIPEWERRFLREVPGPRPGESPSIVDVW
ncbi:MAG TPA: DUF1348 family protein [Planctomycetota bacterium]|jgi:nuclear transport factor 2 (NTF2) superfamily protein|nr:DUF1348 family protein [Planctomycetota bacterium]